MKVLDLSLKHCWYDMIASGVKKEEYREIKDFYTKRLVGRSYDAVRFHRGQGSPVTMLVECKGIHAGYGKPEWGAVDGERYFVIELGELL